MTDNPRNTGDVPQMQETSRPETQEMTPQMGAPDTAEMSPQMGGPDAPAMAAPEMHEASGPQMSASEMQQMGERSSGNGEHKKPTR
jgi:hypothetical protein